MPVTGRACVLNALLVAFSLCPRWTTPLILYWFCLPAAYTPRVERCVGLPLCERIAIYHVLLRLFTSVPFHLTRRYARLLTFASFVAPHACHLRCTFGRSVVTTHAFLPVVSRSTCGARLPAGPGRVTTVLYL